jgi:GYF domain 2
MKYFIKRDLNEYGPYTLADLQRYIAQGNILLTDLTRSEGMTDWVPVSQVIGNIPVPVPAPAPALGATGTVYGGAPAQALAPVLSEKPPNLHWGLLLLLHVVTCGLFGLVWMFVEAAWVKKIRPSSQAVIFWALAVAGFVATGIVGAMGRDYVAFAALLRLGSVVSFQVGNFKLRSDLEEYYNSVEPINLQLSGVMTFFFSFIYFQYHFNRICRWKETGVLQPQG